MKTATLTLLLLAAGCNSSVTIDLAGLQPLSANAPATLAPRASTRVLASGGTRPYAFAWESGAPRSGPSATLDPSTGELRAGPLGRVQERIVVTDQKGEVVTVELSITPALAVDPTRALVDPGSYADFDAVGGQPPYRFALLGLSGEDQVDELTGVLRAGSRGGRGATVRVTDAAGAEATAEVLVTSNFVAGSVAMDVALLDADLDGVLDVAVATNGVGVVPVLKGDGEGNFGEPLTELALGAFPRALVAADLDGDGLDDLAVVGTSPDVLVVYRQKPGVVGGFAEALRWPVGKLPSDVVLLREGASLTLAVSTETSTSVELFQLAVSGGSITVAGAQTLNLGARATRLAVGDFLGDAANEVAVGLTRPAPAKGSVAFLSSDAGTFERSVEVQVGEGTVALGAGNLGGGPHADLAVTSSLSNELALVVDDAATGAPTVSRTPIAAGSGAQCQPCGRPGDAPCVAGAQCVRLKASAETAVCSFTCAKSDDCPNGTDCQPVPDAGLTCAPQLNTCPATSLVATGVNPRAARVVDLDGDGQAEVAVTNVDDLEVFASRGGGWSKAYSAATGPNPWELDVGDVNADGLPDLVTGNRFGQNVTVLLGLGGLFARAQELKVGASPGQVHVGQLDQAEGADVLMQVGDSFLTLLGDGRGGLRPFRRLAFFSPGRLALGDFTGDGFLDFYAFHNLARTVELVRWEPGLGFSGGPTASVGTQPLGLAVGDVNRDGWPDLLVANNLDGTFSAQLGADGGQVASYATDQVYLRYADPAVLPRSTLWSKDEGGHALNVGLGRGNTQLDTVRWSGGQPGAPAWSTTVTGATAAYPVALDCDGDLRQDFALPFSDAVGAAFDVQVYRAAGAGSYALAQALRAGAPLPDGGVAAPGADTLAATDLDGDGDVDLVLSTRISRELVVFHGRGDCSFDLAGRVRTGDALGAGLSLGDLDGDGLPDLAAPMPPDRLVTYLNMGGRTGELKSVPLARGLCEACDADQECGTSQDRCVDTQGRRRLCGRDCSLGRACPDGFECRAFDGGVSQCVHAGAQCVR